VRPALAHAVEEAVLGHYVEHRVRGRGDDRAAGEGRAVVARLEHRGGVRARHAGAHRQPAPEPLGRGHHVRGHAKLLVCPERSGPPHPALDLVEDQQRAVLVTGLASGAKQLGLERVDAGLALDRLEQHRGRALVHRGGQRAGVVARHDPEAGHQGSERSLLRLLGRGGQRAHRPSVEAALHHHELPSLAALAGQLERALDRLGARVAEEYATAERQVGEPLGEPHPGLRVEEVAHVHEPPGLLAHRLDHARVAVAELGDRDAG
jgi:hypothetical protein